MYNTYDENNQGEERMKKLNRVLGSIITLTSLFIYYATGSREVFKVVCDILIMINMTSIIAIIFASFITYQNAKRLEEDIPESVGGDFFVCLLALAINFLVSNMLSPFVDSKLLVLAIAQVWLFSTMTMQISIDTIDRISIV